MRMIAAHGSRTRYYHEVLGVNSRLDTLQAVILNVKLPHLEAYNAARRKAAAGITNCWQGSPCTGACRGARRGAHLPPVHASRAEAG